MTIRTAQPGDVAGISLLYNELAPNAPVSPEPRLGDLWATILGRDDIRYFVAEEDRAIAATCNITIIPNLTHDGRPFAVIENVVTGSSWRRRGCGRGVMEAAIDFARERRCFKVMLLSGWHRAGAHAFYESLGFRTDTKRAFHLPLD